MFILPFLLIACSSLFSVECLQNKSLSNERNDGCLCKEYTCGCCVTLSVPQIGLNDSGCLNFAYLPREYGISVTLEIDGDALINETISARSPIPICAEPPWIDSYIHICLRFYDLDVTKTNFHGCVQIEVKMFYVINLKDWKLGCFDLDLVKLKKMEYAQKLLKSGKNFAIESNRILTDVDWKKHKYELMNLKKDIYH